MSILITGAAGFIGFHLCKLLIEKGFDVVGFDNLNNYYDQKLKKERLNELKKESLVNDGDFIFIKGDLVDDKVLKEAFQIKSKQTKEDRKVVMAFQRRYIPKEVSGKITDKTLKISQLLV